MKRAISVAVLLFIAGIVSGAGKPRDYTAAKLAGKIKIDGKLDEAAWRQTKPSSPLVGLINGETIADAESTTFKILYDDKGIYIGITAKEPNTSKMRSEAKSEFDTMAVFGDDHMEIFLDPVGDSMEYCQFSPSVSGAQTDYYFIEGGNTGKPDYNPNWMVKTNIGKTAYTMEIFIPFTAFHNRELPDDARDWIISVARQRTRGVKAKYPFSIFNAGGRTRKGFHNVRAWGKLKGITVPKEKFIVRGEAASVSLSKTATGYSATCAIKLLNYGTTALSVNVKAAIESASAKTTATLQPGKMTLIEFPSINVTSKGKKVISFTVTESKTGRALFENSVIRLCEYHPIILRMTSPAYRGNIYFTEKIAEISGSATLNIPPSKLKGAKLAVSFKSTGGKSVFEKTYPVNPDSAKVAFKFPASKLPIGTYELKLDLLGSSEKVIASQLKTVKKLGNAPGVEARISANGQTIIDGVPVFMHGFAGNTIYAMSKVSMAAVQTPRCVNIMQGIEEKTAVRMRMFHTVGMSRLPGLEKTAKAGGKLLEMTKKAALAAVEATRYNRFAVGYYLADEPECRGLSPETLRELYELIKKADPYRFCMIVSRAPAQYWRSCDVICPHPYTNPILDENGKRAMAQSFAYIHQKMAEGYEAIDGRAKGLWIMPQVFSYGFAEMNPRSVDPDFDQARWSILSGLANHAAGVMSFMFSTYWNERINRLGVTHVYETLDWMSAAWTEGDERKTIVECENGGIIDVITKKYTYRGISHLYIIAANRTAKTFKAKFSIPEAGKFKRLTVIRENRALSMKDGVFTDEFGVNGAHIYTTCDVIPYMKSLKEIKADISALQTYPANGPNLLRNGKLAWSNGMSGRDARIFGDGLADGNIDSPGWLKWGLPGKEIALVFPDGVKFNKFIFYSHNVGAATLEAWSFGKWRKIAEWKDIHQFKTVWSGKAVKTVKLRLKLEKIKLGHNYLGNAHPCVTEIEME